MALATGSESPKLHARQGDFCILKRQDFLFNMIDLAKQPNRRLMGIHTKLTASCDAITNPPSWVSHIQCSHASKSEVVPQ